MRYTYRIISRVLYRVWYRRWHSKRHAFEQIETRYIIHYTAKMKSIRLPGFEPCRPTSRFWSRSEWAIPSKHKTFLWYLYNVGITSKTLGRRCTNVIQMFCVCWVGAGPYHFTKTFSCKHCVDPLTAGAAHIRFLHFLSAHYISAFKPVKDKKWH